MVDNWNVYKRNGFMINAYRNEESVALHMPMPQTTCARVYQTSDPDWWFGELYGCKQQKPKTNSVHISPGTEG